MLCHLKVQDILVCFVLAEVEIDVKLADFQRGLFKRFTACLQVLECPIALIIVDCIDRFEIWQKFDYPLQLVMVQSIKRKFNHLVKIEVLGIDKWEDYRVLDKIVTL